VVAFTTQKTEAGFVFVIVI